MLAQLRKGHESRARRRFLFRAVEAVQNLSARVAHGIEPVLYAGVFMGDDGAENAVCIMNGSSTAALRVTGGAHSQAFHSNWIIEEMNERGVQIMISQRPQRKRLSRSTRRATNGVT